MSNPLEFPAGTETIKSVDWKEFWKKEGLDFPFPRRGVKYFLNLFKWSVF